MAALDRLLAERVLRGAAAVASVRSVKLRYGVTVSSLAVPLVCKELQQGPRS